MGIVKEVECDLDDFSDEDIIDEVGFRHLEHHFDTNKLDNKDDWELIDELTDRGYTVYGKKSEVMRELFSSYVTDTPEQFKKYLTKLFIENGFHP